MKDEDLEALIRQQKLKESSDELDQRTAALFKSNSSSPAVLELDNHTGKQRHYYLAIAAAVLFSLISAGLVYTFMTDDKPVDVVNHEPSKTKHFMEATHLDESEQIIRGEIITLNNGKLLRPILRTVYQKKQFIDKVSGLQMEIQQPIHEIYYIPISND